jgi:hypothetical protein
MPSVYKPVVNGHFLDAQERAHFMSLMWRMDALCPSPFKTQWLSQIIGMSDRMTQKYRFGQAAPCRREYVRIIKVLDQYLSKTPQ